MEDLYHLLVRLRGTPILGPYTFELTSDFIIGWAKKTGLFLTVCNSRIC